MGWFTEVKRCLREGQAVLWGSLGATGSSSQVDTVTKSEAREAEARSRITVDHSQRLQVQIGASLRGTLTCRCKYSSWENILVV